MAGVKTGSVTRVGRKPRGRGGQLNGRNRPSQLGRNVDGLENGQRLAAGQPAGMHGVRTAPSAEAWQAAVVDRMCPVCLQGPYRVLGLHTNAAHGISAKELKERAGLPWAATTAAPDVTAANRARALAQENRTSPPHGPWSFSPAARQAAAERLRAIRRSTPESVYAAGRTRGHETSRAKAAPAKEARARDRRLTPVPCTVCGTLHYRYRKVVCSDECRNAIRKRQGTARRERTTSRGRCPNGHEYDGVRRDGSPRCSQCQREWCVQYRARKRLAQEPPTPEEVAERHRRRVEAGRASARARAAKKRGQS